MSITTEVINGVLYKRDADDDGSIVNTQAVDETMINDCINQLQSIITNNSDVILNGYKIVKNKTSYLIEINRKRDFIDVRLALHNYMPYVNGMVDYINLILSIKKDEVSTEAVMNKLISAETKDDDWVADQFMVDHNNIIDGIEKIPAIIDCIGMLKDYSAKALSLYTDETDTELLNIKNRAISLLWSSLKHFADNAIEASNKNIDAIKNIISGKKEAPINANDDGGFRML